MARGSVRKMWKPRIFHAQSGTKYRANALNNFARQHDCGMRGIKQLHGDILPLVGNSSIKATYLGHRSTMIVTA